MEVMEMIKSKRVALILTIIFVLAIILTASSCESVKYKLTTDVLPNGSGTVTPGNGIYKEGDQINLVAQPAAGFRFDYWSGSAAGTKSPLNLIMNGNRLVVANFKAIFNLTVSVSPQNGGTVTAASGTYDQGTTVNISAQPAPGYRFVGWSGDVSSTNTQISILMNNDKNITANFIRQYTLNVSVYPAFGGTVTPNGGLFDEGSEVTLTASAADNFAFECWGGDIVGISNSITVTMDGDKLIGVYFSRILTFGVTDTAHIWANFPDITTGHYAEFNPNARGDNVTAFIDDEQYFDNNGVLTLSLRLAYINIVRDGGKVVSFDWQVNFYAVSYDQTWVHTGRFYDIV
jgi:uncharacterized repeat protein (TIGR02543 family)